MNEQRTKQKIINVSFWEEEIITVRRKPHTHAQTQKQTQVDTGQKRTKRITYKYVAGQIVRQRECERDEVNMMKISSTEQRNTRIHETSVTELRVCACACACMREVQYSCDHNTKMMDMDLDTIRAQAYRLCVASRNACIFFFFFFLTKQWNKKKSMISKLRLSFVTYNHSPHPLPQNTPQIYCIGFCLSSFS